MSGFFATKRALITGTIDDLQAPKLYSEAKQFKTACNCADPNLQRDQYDRLASPFSLPTKDFNNPSPCLNGTDQHLQQRLHIENTLTRPYLEFTTSPTAMVFPYDTLGQGRQYQDNRSGDGSCAGAWVKKNMPTEGPSCNIAPPAQNMRFYGDDANRLRMYHAMNAQYLG